MKIYQWLAAAKLDPSKIGYTEHITNADASLKNFLNSVYLIAGMIAVLVIVGAGFIYVTSSGDPAKITKARNAIIGGVAGLILVVFAFAITLFILGGVS